MNWTLESVEPETYRKAWDHHVTELGYDYRYSVTHLNDEEYRDLYRNVFDTIGPNSVKRMLDYGCGPSLLIPIVTERWPGLVYEGADISKKMIYHCRVEFPGIKHYLLPEEKPEGKYDFLTCHSVFTHITLEDARKLLDELRELLTDDGTASISVLYSEGEPVEGYLMKVGYKQSFWEKMVIDHGFIINGCYHGLQNYYGVSKCESSSRTL